MRRPSSSASSSASSSIRAAARSTGSAMPRGLTAMSCRSSPSAGVRPATRAAMTARTLCGIAASAGAGRPATASCSRMCRHTSPTRNAFPPVRPTSCSASSPPVPPAEPPQRSTISWTSGAARPPRRTRTTPSRRCSSASVGASASGGWPAPSRNSTSTTIGVAPSVRARWRRRSSDDPSAHCMSSSTSTAGAAPASRASRVVSAACSAWRSASGSPASAIAPAGWSAPARRLGRSRTSAAGWPCSGSCAPSPASAGSSASTNGW